MSAQDLELFYERYYAEDHRLRSMNDVTDRELVRQSRFVLDMLPPGEGRLLDVGCGGGGFCYFALQRFGQVEGVDFCSTALEHACTLVPSARFQKAAAEALPYEAQAFDAVTCVGSLEHFPDMDAALREMRRVLKPQGHLAVLVPNLFSLENVMSVCFRGGILSHQQELERFDTPTGWRDLIERNGFQVLRYAAYNPRATWPMLRRHPRTAVLRVATQMAPSNLGSLLYLAKLR